MTEQRRLAAIVAADVVGYSRLMGRDEGGTLAALKALRRELVDPAIATRGGRIVKTTGDGMLLEFPSVVDAVRCVLDIQTAIATRNADIPEDRRIVLRVGVNLGDIIIEGDDIFGDGVNIAARLQEIARPGGIAISRRVHEDVRDRLEAAFEDAGEQTLKNIERPVAVWRWSPDGAPVAATAPAAPAEPFLALPDKPSIAVLPFVNMSGDPEQEYFADGITEDLITNLSHVRWLFVIARNSTFTYKGRAVDLKQVGRELGVRYVLEGSVRKLGQRVRITAQLIDGTTGAHHWAERYDRELTDIFALQDEITQSVGAAIEPRLLAAEGLRSQRRSAADLDAWDLVMRALPKFWRMTPADASAAVTILRQAAERYPDYAPAHSMLGFALIFSAQAGWLPRDAFTAGDEAARRAVMLDENDPWAHVARGYAATYHRNSHEAIAEIERGLELNPNFAAAHGYLGLALAFACRPDEAIAHFQRALRMSPLDSQNVHFVMGIGASHFVAKRYPEAVEWYKRGRQQRPEAPMVRRSLAAVLALMGRVEEAKAELASARKLQPELSIAWVERNVPHVVREPLERYLEGLRIAGLE